MILYFTGTGNSKYVAVELAKRLDDTIVSLNDVLKHSLAKKFSSQKPFVVVAPIYAWRFPKVIEDLVEQSELEGSKEIYFVATMGSETGKTEKYMKKLCDKKGLTFKGLAGIPLPSNYIISGPVGSAEEIESCFVAAQPKIDDVVCAIRNGDMVRYIDSCKFSSIKSGIVHNMFTKYSLTSDGFVVSEECIGCGKCADFCPANNIQMEDKKPVFQKACINCYGCINRCPKAAINIKGKTENNGRYMCPR